MRFPLTCDGPDDPNKEFVEIVNAAFYTGYQLALCESKEELNSLTFMDRIALMCCAKAKAENMLEDIQL